MRIQDVVGHHADPFVDLHGLVLMEQLRHTLWNLFAVLPPFR